MTAQKIVGLLIVLLGVPLGFMASDRVLLSVMASIGLMMIFFAREPIEDERVQHLKMKAMFTAMSVGIAVASVGYYYLCLAFPRLRTDPSTATQMMSAHEFLAAVLLIALGLFHYWRWQDAK